MANSYLPTSSDVQARNIVATFTKLTGIVKLTFEHRNPRLEGGSCKLYYKLSGGSWVQVTSQFTPISSQNSPFFNTSRWEKSTISWNVFQTFTLVNKGNVEIKLEVFDDDMVLSATLLHNAISIDLTPELATRISPKDFGKVRTPIVEFYLPALLRSSTIQPKLIISTSSTFSSGNAEYTSYKLSTNKSGVVTSMARSASTSTRFTSTNHGLAVNNKVSISNGNFGKGDVYHGTFTVTAISTNNFTVTSNVDPITNSTSNFRIANPAFSSASTSTFTYHGINNTRKTIRYEGVSSLNVGTKYYVKIDLQCT